MKLLQINTTLNTTSTGRIAEEIGICAIEQGYESYASYKHIGPGGSRSETIKIGNELDRYLHGVKTRVLDRHGFGSRGATRELVNQIREIDPDVIGLHNLHGYYLNIEVLFRYLKEVQKPVVWTFHDCWPFTGHCAYFERAGCEKWKTECHNCPLKSKYPASYGLDRSNRNFHQKKELFTGLENLTIVTPSHWLKDLVKQSFLHEYPVEVIHNGIDLETFKPGTDHLPNVVKEIDKKIILGVASVWDERKGLREFEKLAPLLEDDYQVVLVGLSNQQIGNLPENILGIARTENVQQLASLYSIADVFVNPTLSDNFPTTNLEALACGTPVVTYNTGGSPEALDDETGIITDKKVAEHLYEAVCTISKKNGRFTREICRERAIQKFNKQDRYNDYLGLYESMLSKN